ncbi:MAG: DNA polymerase III subunit delta' [Thermoleophilia bacterium]|nr:DNA polymerase III subunit delta' [Thermoleophilia bacterium]
MEPFAAIPEQAAAKRLLASALADGDAHAFLFHGPAGVGKEATAFAFAGALLGDPRRVAERTHPDLRIVEPLGDMIRIDVIRELHHDLHLRPFESDRRVYLLLGAHRLNDDAAGALLKDLEEPPLYATIVLVADALGPIPETVRSRCQLVPFSRLSERAVRAFLAERAPDLADVEATAIARVAAGRLDRANRLIDPAGRAQRATLIATARATYLDPAFDSGAAANTLLEAIALRGADAREAEEAVVEGLDLPLRDAEQRVKRVQRGAESEEMLAQLEELAAWYRDLVVVATGAEAAVVHADYLVELRTDVALGLGRGPERAAARVRQSWRSAETFNVNPGLWLDALFVQLQRVFG